MAGHNSIKRIVHRCCEEVKATQRIAKETSFLEGLQTFQAKCDIQIMNHNGYYENEARKKHLIRKHDIMIRYYEKTFGDFLKTYNYDHVLEKSEYSDCIWICWWQGLEQAPAVVKRCVDSIKKHAGNHPVIILTEDNYKNYVDIPAWLEEKKNKGIITRTNYSDLLRLSLLAKHGGMWIDSTFLCTSDEIQDYFNWPLWSIKRPDYFHASVASGYFAGYSLYCSEENRYIFATIRDFFIQYWKENDFMVDYLMVDYMIVLAQKYDKNIAEAFKEIKSNNPECDELYKILQDPFDQSKWNELKENTPLFKLTWKQQYPEEKNGKKTFYGALMEGTI